MGSGSSRKNVGPKLSLEKQMAMWNLFHEKLVKRSQAMIISSKDLLEIWTPRLSHSLMQIFLNYLFRSSTETSLEKLEGFYFSMVDGSFESRAKMLIDLIGIADTIPRKTLETFLQYLLESYFLVLRERCRVAYESWSNDDLEAKKDSGIFCKFMISELPNPEGKVDQQSIEYWLNSQGILKEIWEHVINHAFGIEADETQPKLPYAQGHSILLRIPSVISLSYYIRESEKQWRLLYSSTEAQSWNIFINRLFTQGPTIILVQDDEGNLFGGYASTSWRIGPNFFGDDNCFLFGLRPELKIFLPTRYNTNYQYLNTGASTLPNGLGMGGQVNYFGFFLSSEFGPGNVSKTCTTFRDYVPFTPKIDFTFTRVEVWGVGKPDEIEEGVRESGPGGLIMQRDIEAVAMLELSGKTGHAKAAGVLPDPDE